MNDNVDLQLPDVVGTITVDLIDSDTGKVLQREQGHNFISNQSKAVARWFQRFMWGQFCPVETNDAAGYRPSEMPWFPADHLAYWNDATAENAATERNIATELTGWASRNPVGSPSGKRGVVNISESELTDSSAKWVFDWVTRQGNGTFQSVGWCRVDETTNFPMARFPEPELVSVTSTGANVSARSALGWDATGSKWLLLDGTNTPSFAARVVSVGTGGGTSTVECTLTGWNYTNSVGAPHDVELSGTSYIVCGQKTATGTFPRLTKNDSSGGLTWQRDETSLVGVFYRGVTVDGSGKIWTAGSDGIVRRHSAADGTVELTITPALSPTTLNGIAYDSADGHFWLAGYASGNSGHHQVWKVDNSGGTIGPLFGLNVGGYTVASTVGNPEPVAGVYYVPASNGRDSFTWVRNYGSGVGNGFTIYRGPSVANNLSGANTYGMALAVGPSGELYAGISAAGLGTAKISPLRGYTLGSRVKLSSPVTKTSSNNLKVTYQLDFV